MKLRVLARRVAARPSLNFVLTNFIPRAAATRFMGWFSRIENPLVRSASIAAWRVFTDVDLSDARRASFRSLHDCFIRELKPGARPVDARVESVVSPCDAIVGACGTVRDGMAIQAKHRRYPVSELLGDAEFARQFSGGTFVTLRLTAGMYHRFHAPHDCRITHVTFVPGDVWNVNPPTLSRVDRVFCRNERAVLRTRLHVGGSTLAIVPVAAVLVASLRLRFVEPLLDARYRGPREIDCDVEFKKGDELGWFQHGSTILVFAPPGFRLPGEIIAGARVRAGECLLMLPQSRTANSATVRRPWQAPASD